MSRFCMNVGFRGVVVKAVAASLIACFTGSSTAASFDCKKASTRIERNICDDTEISYLDENLGKGYRDALRDSGKGELIRSKQREWLALRDKCSSRACLVASYVSRLADFKRASLSGPAIDPSVGNTASLCEKVIGMVNTKEIANRYVKANIPQNGESTSEYVGVDLDGDGRPDTVRINSGSQESLLTVLLSGGGDFDFDGGVMAIVKVDEVLFVLETYLDNRPSQPTAISHRLSLLSRRGVIPICDAWSETQFNRDR